MRCTNCGREITPGSSVAEESYLFCNAICRFEWKGKGKPTPFASKNTNQTSAQSAVSDLEFPINPPGFENRNMRVRLRYMGAPKLFLDGTLMTPVKSGFLSRKREYTAVSNFGKQVSIRMQGRFLDQIPEIKIDGQPFLIARRLTRWEYLWISLPLLLLFLGGGLIGGAIAAAASLSNSILMRRVPSRLPRYLLTGATTAMAVFLFIRLATSFSLILNTLGISPGTQSAEEQLAAVAAEINRKCPYMLDDETRADSLSGGPGQVLTYHFTLVKQSVNKIDIPRLQEALRAEVARNIKTNPDMETLRKLQVMFVYKYADRSGLPAFDISVPPSEYQ